MLTCTDRFFLATKGKKNKGPPKLIYLVSKKIVEALM